MVRIVIDGLISAGKTTLIRRATKMFPELAVYEEPVEKYTLLEDFYRNPKENAAKLQKQIYEIMLLQEEELKNENFSVTERCPSSGHIFCNVLFRQEVLEKKDFISSDFKPDLYIWVVTDPKVCLERIAKRGRKGEEEITLDYLLMLEEEYQKEYNRLKSAGVWCIKIDG